MAYKDLIRKSTTHFYSQKIEPTPYNTTTKPKNCHTSSCSKESNAAVAIPKLPPLSFYCIQLSLLFATSYHRLSSVSSRPAAHVRCITSCETSTTTTLGQTPLPPPPSFLRNNTNTIIHLHRTLSSINHQPLQNAKHTQNRFPIRNQKGLPKSGPQAPPRQGPRSRTRKGRVEIQRNRQGV